MSGRPVGQSPQVLQVLRVLPLRLERAGGVPGFVAVLYPEPQSGIEAVTHESGQLRTVVVRCEVRDGEPQVLAQFVAQIDPILVRHAACAGLEKI